jgi:hypothetical protein
MSSIGVLDRPERASIFLQNNPLELLEFDAIISETHQGDAIVTDHPVEEGVDISDHVRRQPESFTCQIIVSNAPILVNRSVAARPSVRGGDPNNRAEDAYGFIKELKDGGQLVGFSTTLRDYDNMVITSTAASRDSRTGNILDMTLTIREIVIANTETVAAPEPVNPSRKTKTKLGKKPKADASPATAAKTDSLGSQIFDAGIRAFGGGG